MTSVFKSGLTEASHSSLRNDIFSLNLIMQFRPEFIDGVATDFEFWLFE
jgi:hypothetical protein